MALSLGFEFPSGFSGSAFSCSETQALPVGGGTDLSPALPVSVNSPRPLSKLWDPEQLPTSFDGEDDQMQLVLRRSRLGPWPAGGQHQPAGGKEGQAAHRPVPSAGTPALSKGSSLSQPQETCNLSCRAGEAASPLGQQLWRPFAHCDQVCSLVPTGAAGADCKCQLDVRVRVVHMGVQLCLP